MVGVGSVQVSAGILSTWNRAAEDRQTVADMLVEGVGVGVGPWGKLNSNLNVLTALGNT